MTGSSYTIRPLDLTTWDASAALVEANGGIFGGCWCVGFRPDDCHVEGYPEPADAFPAGFLFNGALSTYEAAGFRRDRMIGKHRWIVTRHVAQAD